MKNRLYIPPEGRYRNDGVLILFYPDTKRVRVEAWTDGNFAVADDDFSLKEFLEKLGISKEDCLEALEEK